MLLANAHVEEATNEFDHNALQWRDCPRLENSKSLDSHDSRMLALPPLQRIVFK